MVLYVFAGYSAPVPLLGHCRVDVCLGVVPVEAQLIFTIERVGISVGKQVNKVASGLFQVRLLCDRLAGLIASPDYDFPHRGLAKPGRHWLRCPETSLLSCPFR